MLAGFVVPHAHYRVFHGDPAADSQHAAPNDQFPLALSPRRLQTAPTDLHLREFAQLEVQIKALQLQKAQHPKPAAMGRHLAGSMAECFLFYSRLLTVESYVWPDFLAAVFTKLAEHFTTSDNEIVRSAILRVFQRAKAHVAQVNDPTKLLSQLSAPLKDEKSVTGRTLTLQLLATMPSLIAHDTAVQQQILAKLTAEDDDERAAAIEAARALLPHSPAFRKDALEASMKSTSASLCYLLADAVSNPTEAQEAWTHCAEIYERLADDKSAVASVRAMTTLTATFPSSLLDMHGQLLHHVLDHDPRPLVRNFVVLAAQQLITKEVSVDDRLVSTLNGVFSQVGGQNTQDRVEMRVRLSALVLLDKWSGVSEELGEEVEALLKAAKEWVAVAKDSRFGKAYVSIVSNIARHKLKFVGSEAKERHNVDELLLLLHPRAAVATKDTWGYALDALAQLSREFPDDLAVLVASRLIELLAIPTDDVDAAMSDTRKTSILRVLGAQVRPPPTTFIRDQLPALLKEVAGTKQHDASRLRALAAVFFLWTQNLPGDDRAASDSIEAFEKELLKPEHYESHADRYEMAKLAMLRGRFALAAQLIAIIAATSDSECFGGWLHALQTLCRAEADTMAEQSVNLESLQSLARTSMYLQAARTSSFRFDFQLHVVGLRLEWMQLLQSAQQLAGEAAYTNTAGNAAGREGHLSKQLRTLAHKFGVLRSSLLGADQRDLDVLEAHAKMCTLLAAAVEGFLFLRSPEAIDWPTGPEPKTSQWNVRAWGLLSEDALSKLGRLAKLPAARRPNVGARVLQHFLAAMCAVPPPMSRLFFCSRLRADQRLLSSAQFLTYAENAAFTAKPRSRSQLGVSLGTDFTSILKGVLALSYTAEGYWRERAEAIDVEVIVSSATAGITSNSPIYELTNSPAEEKLVQHRIHVQLPIAWDQVFEPSKGEQENDGAHVMLYLPFETPVHVKAANLALKGSFVLVAKIALVDREGARWALAATGCRRGFIVY